MDDTLQELTDTVTRRLSLLGAAISLAQDGVLRCVSAAPSPIRELEAAQTVSREGPCSHAFVIGEPVLVPRLDREPAKGMVGHAHEVSMDLAFARIQRHARSHHTSVRAVADAVVNLGLHI